MFSCSVILSQYFAVTIFKVAGRGQNRSVNTSTPTTEVLCPPRRCPRFDTEPPCLRWLLLRAGGITYEAGTSFPSQHIILLFRWKILLKTKEAPLLLEKVKNQYSLVKIYSCDFRQQRHRLHFLHGHNFLFLTFHGFKMKFNVNPDILYVRF